MQFATFVAQLSHSLPEGTRSPERLTEQVRIRINCGLQELLTAEGVAHQAIHI